MLLRRVSNSINSDTSYDIVYQARYKSGDGVGYVRAADFGQEYGFQESNPLYVVTRGKDFMSQEGPVSFCLFLTSKNKLMV